MYDTLDDDKRVGVKGYWGILMTIVDESAVNNTVYGSRITYTYCEPSCVRNLRVKDGDRINFDSGYEARAQGFIPCQICNPDTSGLFPQTLWASHFKSPLGVYLVVSSRYGIICVEPVEQTQKRLEVWEQTGMFIEDGRNNEYNLQATDELSRYFGGELRDFTVQLDMRGTSFQRIVWDRLVKIPYGETCSYGNIAQEIDRPLASRAVGRANGQNPVSIIVPCHRVIGSSGRLVGYGGGLDRKDFLLNLERNSRVSESVRHRDMFKSYVLPRLNA